MDNSQIEKWLAEGKITKEQAAMMIEENTIARKEKSSNKFLSTVSVIGANFLGIGIIWIVAANWDGIPDLLKILLLLLLTGGMIYLGYEIGFNRKNFPKTGHSLVLSGALSFGASIFLIAQIYNVSANSSFLIFIWLLGILPMVYIFQSALIAFLSCIIFCIWFNSIVFEGFNNFNPVKVSFIVFFYQTFGLLLFAIGSLHYFLKDFVKVARAYRIIGIYLTLAILFILTFMFSYTGLKEIGDELNNHQLVYSIIYVIGVSLLAINFKYNPSQSTSNVLENGIALAVLSAIFVLNLAIHLDQLYILFWVLFNALFIALIIILFKLGYDRMDMKLVNIASISTFLFVMVKFFDIFSNLLNNGITWILFGILLLIASVFLEKKRRTIRDKFNAKKVDS